MFMYDEILQQPLVIGSLIQANQKTITGIKRVLTQSMPKTIVIAARGTSDHAAVYAKYCFEILLGIPTSLAAPSVLTVYNSKIDYKNTLIIGITQSGMAEDVKAVIEHARAQGAVTLACTNQSDSPVAKAADFHFFCNAGTEKSVAATKTFMAQLCAVLVLAAVMHQDPKLLNAIETMGTELELFLKQADKIVHDMASYKYMDKCFVLGRGLLYPIVKEAALKIQETSYAIGLAYPISDFWHGPLAMVSDKMPVFLYSSGGKMKKDEMEILDKLNKIGADVFVVTPDKEIAQKAAQSLMIPDVNMFIQPLIELAAAQLIAFGIAKAKGMNPDAPRNLKKVTITK